MNDGKNMTLNLLNYLTFEHFFVVDMYTNCAEL